MHIRWAQLFFHLTTASTGIVLAIYTSGTPFFWNAHFVSTSLFLGALIALAWIASAMINDYHDHAIDRISNADRPLPSGTISPETYKFLSFFLHFLIPGAALLINPIVALFLTAYLAISLAYNTPPLRLKRFPLVGTFAMGLALQMIIFAGFALIAPNHITHTYPYSWSEIFVALGIFALIAPIKDFKDVDGDRAHGVLTIPVLLGPIGARIVIAIGIITLVFASLALFGAYSPLLLLGAFLSATLAISFLFLSKKNKLITERYLLWWMLIPANLFTDLLYYTFFIHPLS